MVTVDVLGTKMALLETSAPARYDYAGLTVMGDKEPTDGSTRMTLVPAEVVEAQLARYASGLHSRHVVEEHEVTPQAVIDRLRQVLYEQLGA